MKQDRLFLTAGFMPAVAMATLLLLEQLLNSGVLPGSLWVVAAAEAAVYLLPALVLRLLPDGEGGRARFRFRPYRRQAIPLVLWMSLATALLAALANYGFSLLLGDSGFSGGMELSAYGVEGFWTTALAVVVLPAVTEELFFRGVLFSALERCGTWPALLLSALAFALIHGDAGNFAGPLAAGLLYGYLTYVLDSVWPAIVAHGVSNALAWGLSGFAGIIEALGLWPLALLVMVFCLCLFTAMATGAMDTQIEKGRVRRLQYDDRRETLTAVLVSPGMWLVLLLFFVRVLY